MTPLEISKSAIQSDMNCFKNVVSYAQIALKKHIFEVVPANVHVQS